MSDTNPRDHADLFRALLWERDRSICAECGLDCDKKRAELLLMGRQARERECRRLKIACNPVPSLWHAHHRIALSEGGENTMANQITLCVRCHRWVTAEQNRRATPATKVGSDLTEMYG